MGGGMALNQVISRLAVSLSLETAAFEKGATKSEKRMNKMRRKFSDFGKSIAIGAAGIGTAIAGINKVFGDLAQKSKEMGNAAQVAGESFEDFQRQAYGARMVGVEFDKLGDIFKDVRDRIGDFAQTGGGPMADFFENIAPKVGVTAKAFEGLGGRESLQLYYDSLKKANVSQEDMVFYLEAMASDATNLIPLLENGGAAWEKYGDKAAVFTEDQRAQLQRYEESMNKLDNSLQQLALTLVDSGLIDKFANFAEQLSAVTEGFSGVAVAANATDEELKKTEGARKFGEDLRGLSDGIDRFVSDYDLAMNRWADENAKVRQQIAGWATSIGNFFSGLSARASEAMRNLYVGVKTWLQDKLGAVFSWVQDKIKAVERTFYWLGDQVVFNSHIPDMVERIGQHMSKLQALMVDPATRAAKDTEAAFRNLSREVGGILDRLFPKVAALKAMKDDISSIDAGVKAGVISADVGEEARSRARRVGAGLDLEGPSATVSDDILNAPKLTEGMESLTQKLKGVGDTGEAQTMRLTNALQNLGGTFGGVAGTIANLATSIINPAMQSSIDKVSQLQAAMQGVTGFLQKIFGNKVGGILGGVLQIAGTVFGGGGGGIPGFANGTSFAPGGLAMVGERGPELVNLPRGSQVFSNSDSQAMMQGRGAPQRIVIEDTTGLFKFRVDQQIGAAAPTIIQTSAQVSHQQSRFAAHRRLPR